MLYLQRVMAKYLRYIGLLVLALALWQTASGSFIGKELVGDQGIADIQTLSARNQQDGACFSSPQLPYLPDAELAGTSGHTQWLTSSRVQRSSTTEYIFSLRDWVDKLAQHEAVLSLHREKLYDATAYYRCQPVCEYYIFTLRRILI